MGKNVMKFKNFAKTINDRTFNDYYVHLSLLAKSVFKWNNLPKNINEKWIEKYLYNHGECMIFEDKDKGLMVTKVNKIGLNYYDEPTDLEPYATNYSNKTQYKNGVNAVLIRNNDESIPTFTTIQLFAYRLTDITRTIDINIHAQKTPVLMKGTDKTILNLKNTYSEWDSNEPVIYHDKSYDDGFSVYKTDAPIVFPQLQVQKHAIYNECYTFLGINNANQEKKERLVESEVDANDDQVMMNAHIMLKARQQACDEINRIFRTNISVELRNPLKVSEGSEGDSKGGELND